MHTGSRVELLLVPPSRTPTTVPIDLEVYKVEITQGIQCLSNPSCPDNSVQLYTHKPTLVRAYVRVVSGASFVTGISGAICYGVPGPGGCTDPIRPLAPIRVERLSDPSVAWRGRLDYTLNFLLPASWVSGPASSNLSVYANYLGENLPEPNLANNQRAVPLKVAVGQRLDVVFTTTDYRGFLPSVLERWPLVAWLQRVYPTMDVRVWSLPVRLKGVFDFDSTSGGGCRDGWTKFMDALTWLRGGYPQHYFGMVDVRAISGSVKGCGRYEDPAAASIVATGNRRGGQITAQEIGHNLDRHHAPGFGAGGPDLGYPDPIGLIDEYGIDITRMQLYPPSVSFDFMGYGGAENTSWVSVYTYRAIAAKLPSGVFLPPGGRLASPGQADGREFLVASGSLRPSVVVVEEGFFRLSLPAAVDDGLPDGRYAVRLLDGAGVNLFERSFGPAVFSDRILLEEGSFHIVLPWVEGTQSVSFLYDGTEVGRVDPSASPPQVHVIEPNGAADWGLAGPVTLEWEGTDPDGDGLSYIVQYRSAESASWRNVAANLGETSLTMDASEFPGGPQGRIRVLASDGFFTVGDDSDASFAVADKPPQVSILWPEDGATIPQGNPQILIAGGTDLEDGPLAEGAPFIWVSDLEGELGSGMVVTPNLRPGWHTITLTSTDSTGGTGSASIQLQIEAPVDRSLVAAPSPDRSRPFWIGIVVVGLVASLAAAAAAVAFRSRKGSSK